MDRRLRSLERRSRAADDPDDRARLRAQLRRVADLEDRVAWRQAADAAQDLVIDAVVRLLGPSWAALDAGVFACNGEAHRVGVVRHLPSGIVFHLLPGGSFTMGSLAGGPFERPRHVARVAPLLLGRYPVLQREWDALALPGEDARTWVGPDLPIEGVTWEAARRWLERAGLRLPREAEWEWACRAGTTSEWFWGPEPDPAWAWFGEGGAWRSHPPAQHDARANAFGLVDASGNVAEWCEDAFAPYPPPPGPAPPRRRAPRVIRGGDSFNRPTFCRSAYRSWAAPGHAGAGIGLRAARDLPW